MTAVTEVMVLAMVAGIAVLLVRFLSNYLHFRKLELAIPGPPSPFLLGNALDFAVVTPNNVMKTVLRMIGDRKEMCRFSVFNNLMVSVQDPEQLEEVFRCKKFDDKSIFFYNLLHVVAKKGLVQMNGPEWKAHRRWLEPGFNQNLLNTFGDVFSGEAKAYVDRVEVDKEVDVVEDLRKASVRNFIRTSTSKDSSEYDDVAMEGCEFLELFLRTVNNRSFNPALWSDRVFAVTPLGKKVQETKKTIDNLCNGFIVKKRAELKSHNNELDYERARKTLLDIMLEVPDPSTGMPEQVEDDVISDEIKTLFAANVETTVATLSWVLKALSLLPEVQEQAQAELFSVFGASDRAVSIQDLPKLEYISRVIKEVLRMFPAIPFFGRQCYEETKLCGHTIPAGTTIFVNAFAAHYDPKYWDRPEVFDPDRFLPERSKGRHPYAYLAFSLGPRRCVGYNYAMMNMTIFVATVLRAFKVLPVGEHKDLKSLADNMSFALTSYLLGGMRVRFQRRVAEST